ncbi:MAG: 4Fe-4S binding protein, partial [Saprospiraceae bacterium]
MADTKNTWYEEIIEDTEAYRDKIATVDEKGHRIWMYPKKPVGKYYNRRNLVALLFVILFVATPFIKVNDEPFMLFNVLERKFVLFGILFTPQDFHLFVLAMLTFFVFIILFTVVYGRLFCGWVCPQTVFMEMIFRKIEYAIEGDGQAQRKLDAAPWTAQKIRKKALKHLVFFGIAVFVSNFFLAYIIGADQVLNIIREPVSKNFGGFIAMMVFSGAFYLVFARLREQVCTTICPYGRMQGVLLVKDSIVVAYDHVRGEPRGKLKKHHPASEPGPGADLSEVSHKTQG